MKGFILTFIAGLLYALNFPTQHTESLFISGFLSFTVLLMGLRQSPSLKLKIFHILIFSLGFYLLGYYWIPFTISEFGGIPSPFNYILGLFFSPLTLVHLYPTTLAIHFLDKKFEILNKTWGIPLIGMIFTAFEILTPEQFPAHSGHSWLILAPYIGLTPFYGAGIFSFFNFYLAAQIEYAISKMRFDYIFFPFTLFFLTLNFIFQVQYSPTDESINVRIVQANIGSITKVLSETGDEHAVSSVLGSYYEQSTRTLSQGLDKLDLIIWPETALPGLLSSQELYRQGLNFPPIISDIAKRWDAEFMFGGYDIKETNGHEYFEDQYNTIYHSDSNGSILNHYHKMKLIPFGETLPFGPLNKYLSLIITNVSFFAEGEKISNFKTKGNFNFFPIICYEILFPYFVNNNLNKLKEKPDFFLNITNDSWYGDTSEPFQHLFLAHWRSIETKIPIIRSTNTGITSILFPDGSESERLAIGDKNRLDLVLYKTLERESFFQKNGHYPLFILMGLITLLSFLVIRLFKLD